MSFKHEPAAFFLNFEDNTNLARDVSGFDRNGTNVGVTQGTVGGLTNAGIFNGASYINMDANVSQVTGLTAFSMFGRIRPTSVVGTQAWGSVSDTSNASTDCIIYQNNADVVFQLRVNNVLNFRIIVASQLVANTDYFVACSCGPSGAKLWLNTTQIGSNPNTDSLSVFTPDSMKVGANTDSAGNEFFFNGAMKDWYFAKQEIDQATVNDIFNNDNFGYYLNPLIGQSNEIGRAALRAGIDDVYTAVSGIVFQYGFDAQARLAATNPLDQQDETAGSMGNWLTLWNDLVSSLAYKKQALMIPAAKGATSFSGNNWNPGDVEYEAALVRHNAAAALNSLSTIGHIHCMLGESDALAGSTNVQTPANAMFTDMQSRWTKVTSSTPFVVVSIIGPTSVPANVTAVNASWQAWAAEAGTRYYIDATDLTEFDGVHYDAASLATIGTRSASALLVTPQLEFTLRNWQTGSLVANEVGIKYYIRENTEAGRQGAAFAFGTFNTDGVGYAAIQPSGIVVGTDYSCMLENSGGTVHANHVVTCTEG